MPRKAVTCPDTGVQHRVYTDFRINGELWDIATNQYLERYSAITGDSIDDLQEQFDWSFYIDEDVLNLSYREILAHIRAVL
jgi:hypothetical protein